MANIRIKDQTTDTALSAGDYVIVDNATEGTRKFDLGQKLVDIDDDFTDVRQDLSDLEDRVEALEEGGGGSGRGGLTEGIRQALLDCFANVAWINGDGQVYYDALESALYPPANLSYISAVYTQSGTVYDTDSLDSLKSDLVVTAHFDNGTTQTVTNYVLSGTLTEGTSTITVSYGGKTATFTVTVTEHQVPDTSAVIKSANMGYGTNGAETALTGASTTEPMSAGKTYTTADGQQQLKYVFPKDTSVSFSASKCKIPRFMGTTFVNYGSTTYVDASLSDPAEQTLNVAASEYDSFAFTLATQYIDDSYAYVEGTGYIIFAGKNTKYYGMSNISEATS